MNQISLSATDVGKKTSVLSQAGLSGVQPPSSELEESESFVSALKAIFKMETNLTKELAETDISETDPSVANADQLIELMDVSDDSLNTLEGADERGKTASSTNEADLKPLINREVNTASDEGENSDQVVEDKIAKTMNEGHILLERLDDSNQALQKVEHGKLLPPEASTDSIDPPLSGSSSENISSENIFPKEMSSENMSSKEMSSEDISAKEMSSEDISAKEMSSESISAKERSSEGISAKEMSSEDISAKEMSSESISAKEMSSEGIFAKEMSSESISSKEMSSKEMSLEDTSPESIQYKELFGSTNSEQAKVSTDTAKSSVVSVSENHTNANQLHAQHVSKQSASQQQPISQQSLQPPLLDKNTGAVPIPITAAEFNAAQLHQAQSLNPAQIVVANNANSQPQMMKSALVATDASGILASGDVGDTKETGLSHQLAGLANQQGAQHAHIRADMQQAIQQPLHLSRETAAEKLSEHVQMMLSKNLKNVDIRLEPSDLGRMQIRMTMNSEGASVQFMVANQQTKEIVEQTMPRLREMLAQQGVELSESSVNQQNSGQRQNQYTSEDESGMGRRISLDREPNLDENINLNVNIRSKDDGISYYA